MEDILNIVIESDEKAREITKKAKEDKKIREKEILNERDNIYNEYITLAKDRIAKDLEKTKIRESEKLKDTIKANELLKNKMEEHFTQNRTRWVDSIFSDIVGDIS